MKFQQDKSSAPLVLQHNIHSVHLGLLRDGQPSRQEWRESFLLQSKGAIAPWSVGSFADLTPAHFEQITQLRPQVVILGTGQRLRFVAPNLTQALMLAHIGMETMDTGAACRTYNVLAAEGRDVLLAVLFDEASASIKENSL